MLFATQTRRLGVASLATFLFSSLAAGADPPPVTFVDKTAETGVQLANGAACWADFDNDGFVDISTAAGVFRNLSGKSFEKIGGVGEAVAADFDNDGYLDLFSWSSLKLFRNDQGKGFSEAKLLPEVPKCVSRGACWGDFNGDGFADIFVGGYEDWNKGVTYPSLLLLNQQAKSFRLEWTSAQYRARGVTACDFDEDGDLDIYVSNYRLQPNLLWLNDGKGKLTSAAAERNAVATSPGFGGGHSIGACWGDYNNDGRIDLFAGNFAHQDGRGDQPKSRFLLNLGAEQGFKFQDAGPAGVHYQESYATPSSGDYDNDGRLDVFFTTVYGVASFGRKNNPVLFRNNGSKDKFAVDNVTSAAKLASLPPTYQAAWADYDNDGDLDLVSAGKLFANQGAPQHRWLKVHLDGDGKAVNRAAIGAQVRVTAGEQTVTRQVEAGTGEGNQNDLTLHFGLGKHAGTVRLEVVWPDKSKQQIRESKTNRLVQIQYQKN